MKKNSTINLYFIGLFLLCLLTWEYISNIINFSDSIRLGLYVVTSICFCWNMFCSKYSKKEVLIMIVLLLISLYTFFKIHEINIFITYLAIISSKNVENKKIVRFLLYFNVVLVLFHIIISALGISVNSKIYTTTDGLYRKNFNMRHPNYFAAVLFWTMSSYLYLSQNKPAIVKISLCIIVMFFSYITTYSRTAMILYVLVGILVIVKSDNIKKNIMNISQYFIIGLIALSIIFSYKYFSLSGSLNEFIININDILSNRIYLSALGVSTYNLTILGKNIYSLANEIIVIDSFYITCMISYGIIHMFMLIFTFIKYPKKCENYYKYVFLLLVLVTAITEKYIINIVIVFPLFFLKELLYKENDEFKNGG